MKGIGENFLKSFNRIEITKIFDGMNQKECSDQTTGHSKLKL